MAAVASTDRIEARPPHWRWWLWFAFLAAWTTALLLPGDVFPQSITQQTLADIAVGKFLHVACYAILAAGIPVLPVSRRGRWWLLGCLSAHGALTEFLQSFVPHRGPSLLDVGIDHIGLLLGVALVWPWAGRLGKSTRVVPPPQPQAGAAGKDGQAGPL